MNETLIPVYKHPPLPAPIALPLGSFQHQRATAPVAYDENTDTWHVYRYADVLHVLTDTRNFGTAPCSGSYFSALAAFSPAPPLTTPRHLVVRNLLQAALDPRTVLQLQPYVEHTAGELLDPLLAAGKLEVMSDLAQPLANAVLVELLGVPVPDRVHLELSPAYVARLVTAATSDSPGSPQAPRQNLIGRLLAGEVGGERLTADEVTAACYLFSTAARRALADLLGNTLLLLSLYPDVLARLQREPAPVYSTVEEALRYLPPIWTARRTIIAPVALGGQNLPQGAQVCAWIVSANHDSAQFAQPDRFDIERIPNRHLSCGDNGTFAGQSAGLARLVARLTLAAIAQRISNWDLAPADAVAVASPGEHPLGEQGSAGNRVLDRCSLTKLAIVFDARKPGAE